MRNKMRKKYQRNLNKKIKEVNKSLEDDDLWLGRFVIKQTNANFIKFSDNSGGWLLVELTIYDKKTNISQIYYVEYAPWKTTFNWSIYKILNEFIVDVIKVWEENPNPYHCSRVDWRNKKVEVKEGKIYAKFKR